MRARRSAHLVTTSLVLLAVAGAFGGGPLGTIAPASAATSVTPRVAAGNEHTCALLTDGTVRCWGGNQYGQLGDGTLVQRPNPVAVAGLEGVTELSLGEQHTCALLTDRTVRCWGENRYGQLGDGTTIGSPTPVAVTGLADVTSIAAGGFHTCAALVDGSARCWGSNEHGQVGNGSPAPLSAPVLTPTAVTGLTGVAGLTAGQVHSCALLDDGTARCWGFGNSGRLGTGTTADASTPLEVLASGSTQGIDVLGGITGLSAGGTHTCALVAVDGGTVRCWGANSFGQLGDGGTAPRPNPFAGVSATASGGITAVSAGTVHTCDLRGDGSASCWGGGQYGQLGDGTALDSGVPRYVIGSLDGMVAISSGGLHACALMADDTVRCWGDSGRGQVGDGETVDRTRPVTVLASGTAATGGPAFSVRAAAATAPTPGPTVAVACAPAVVAVGTTVTCSVSGGDPGVDVLWRAAVNPVIAEGVVTLDADGAGAFVFDVPVRADGGRLTVELVAWTAPLPIGVVGDGGAGGDRVGGPVPTAIPAGDGGTADRAGRIGGASGTGATAAAALGLALWSRAHRTRRAQVTTSSGRGRTPGRSR